MARIIRIAFLVSLASLGCKASESLRPSQVAAAFSNTPTASPPSRPIWQAPMGAPPCKPAPAFDSKIKQGWGSGSYQKSTVYCPDEHTKISTSIQTNIYAPKTPPKITITTHPVREHTEIHRVNQHADTHRLHEQADTHPVRQHAKTQPVRKHPDTHRVHDHANTHPVRQHAKTQPVRKHPDTHRVHEHSETHREESHVQQYPAAETDRETPFQPQLSEDVFHQFSPPVFSYASCTPPRNIIDFSWNSEKSRKRQQETFYLLLSHQTTPNSLHRVLTGEDLRAERNWDDFCFTATTNWKNLTLTYATLFGNGKKRYDCNFLDNDSSKFAVECVPLDHVGEAFRSYLIKSDYRTYAAAYNCWESGLVEWVTYSTTRTLPPGAKSEILRLVDSLGFKKNKYRESNYQRCFNDQTRFTPNEKNPAPLPPKLNSYASCRPPQEVVDFNWNSKASQNQEVERFYLPIFHKSIPNSMYKAITGHDLRSGTNIDDFCYTETLNWSNFTIKFAIFGTLKKTYNCNFIENPSKFAWECVPADQDGESFRVYVIRTDYQTYAMTYYCWESGPAEWVTYFTKKSLPNSVKNKVMDAVSTLGFRSDDYKEAAYQRCFQANSPLPSEENSAVLPSKRVSYESCSPPRRVLRFTWNSETYRNRGIETFYTPLSQEKTIDVYYKAITGTNLRGNENTNASCLTTALNWKDFTAVVTMFGTRKEHFRCSFIQGRSRFVLQCNALDQNGESFRVYFTKSDDSTYLVAHHCWEHSGPTWLTFSNAKTLSNELKGEILRHVKTLGFSSTQYRDTDYQHCFPDEHVVEPASKIPSKSCDIPANLVQENKWASVEYLKDEKEVLYIPMAHKLAYKKLNVFASGDHRQQNLNYTNFCMKYEQDAQGQRIVAFNSQVPIRCTKIPNYYRSNGNSWVESWANAADEKLLDYFVTKTDQRTYRVSLQCWESGEKTWVVASTVPTLTPQVRRQIFQHVYLLGFDPQDTQEISYEHCAENSMDVHKNQDLYEESDDTKIVEAESTPTPFPKCSAPPPQYIKEFAFYSPSALEKKKETFYMTMAGSGGYEMVEQLLGLKKSTLANSCTPTYEFDWKNFVAKFQCKETESEPYSCKRLKQENNKEIFAQDCFKDNGEAVFRSYTTFTNYDNYFLNKICWADGHTSWILFSSNIEVGQDLKKSVMEHIQNLGFSRMDYQEINGESCTAEETDYEDYDELKEQEGNPSNNLFPSCSPPPSFFHSFTWESSSLNQGLEFMDVAMAHSKASDIYDRSLGKMTNVKNRLTNQNLQKCVRVRFNYNTNMLKYIGSRDAVSEDFSCTYNPRLPGPVDCLSKASSRLSHRSYLIRSDNMSWALGYQCFNSGSTETSWTLLVSPGTTLSEKTKSDVLDVVESLGFDRNDYIQFGAEQCVYQNRLYQQRICDCCTVVNERYM